MRKILNRKGETHILAIVLAVVIFGGLLLGIGGMLSKSTTTASSNSTKNTMDNSSKQYSDNLAVNKDQVSNGSFSGAQQQQQQQ